MESAPAGARIGSEAAVRERYSAAARAHQAALCCPVDYEPSLLEVIPEEVLQRDYGCGDPSRHVGEGDTVLDLGCGGGKICFIASQRVGPRGRVIGVDMNDEMLALARSAAPRVAERIGYSNVELRRGRIQDLALDADRIDLWLGRNPVGSATDLVGLREEEARLRREEPMVPDASVDVVVSNCVLNLVEECDRSQLILEIHRVLKAGGRIAISDIVSDEPVPEELKRDPELWSGCVSGAFQELDLLRYLAAVGFYGIRIDKWEHEPFAVVDGIEFRPVTVTARKRSQGPCLEANQAVIYAGPWKRVEDDEGHVYERGERKAVCDGTYQRLTSPPYASETIGISPRVPIVAEERREFDCSRTAPRHPRETKGDDYAETRRGSGGCC